MGTGFSDRQFATEGRLARADALAQQRPWLTGAACAELAVRQVFGRWLLDEAGWIKPESLPRYFCLISKVENELDVHRTCQRWAPSPDTPGPQRMARPLPAQAPIMAVGSMAFAA